MKYTYQIFHVIAFLVYALYTISCSVSSVQILLTPKSKYPDNVLLIIHNADRFVYHCNHECIYIETKVQDPMSNMVIECLLYSIQHMEIDVAHLLHNIQECIQKLSHKVQNTCSDPMRDQNKLHLLHYIYDQIIQHHSTGNTTNILQDILYDAPESVYAIYNKYQHIIRDPQYARSTKYICFQFVLHTGILTVLPNIDRRSLQKQNKNSQEQLLEEAQKLLKSIQEYDTGPASTIGETCITYHSSGSIDATVQYTPTEIYNSDDERFFQKRDAFQRELFEKYNIPLTNTRLIELQL